MIDWLNALIHNLEQIGVLDYRLVFLISFLESVAIIGAFFPGTVFIVSIGFIASGAYLKIEHLILLTTLGSILGDVFSYYFGTKGTHFFKDENRLLKLSHLDKGKRFFARYGCRSVLIGKLAGPTRTMVPFVAGLSKMNFGTFILWDILGAFLFSSFYLLLGYFFGDALKTITHASRLAGWIFFFSLVLMVTLWTYIKKRRVDELL